MKETIFGKGIPVIPMMRTLRQFAKARKLPFDSRWETIIRLYKLYNKSAEVLN